MLEGFDNLGRARTDELVIDGDGKVVQPGQKPGQSHGTGHKPEQQR